MSMPYPPQPPAAAEPAAGEYEGPPVPEPPRRVPFGIVLVTALLGVLTALFLAIAVAAIQAFDFTDSIGRAAAGGMLMALLAVCAALTAAVGWSFPRNGNQIGALVVGAAVALIGLILLADVLIEGGSTDGAGYGVIGLVLGMLIILLPMLGDGPGYLASRRVWAAAERDWLREMTKPPTPPPTAFPVQYPQQPPPGYPAPLGQPYPGQPYPGQPYPAQPYPAQQWAQQPPPQQPPR
jgi:hypothetical protein